MAQYHAWTMYDIELPCGCEETVSRYIYDHTGNKAKLFTSKEEAEKVAQEECTKRNDDRWHVVQVRGA